uniref:Uncharacterized protein n=1 Tax=Rhizophora mucronata TaxID=61149 RepID=A0A2P2N8A8_RHIMU
MWGKLKSIHSNYGLCVQNFFVLFCFKF